MKRSLALMLLLCIVFAGCKTTSPKGGDLSGSEKGFKLLVPGRDVSIKQGEIVTVPIEIRRDKFFREDVTVQIQGPEQIRIDPTNVTVKASDMPIANIRFAAPAQAPVSSYRINVTATPKTGKATSAGFIIKVKVQKLH